MRVTAAIVREPGTPWEITELELDEPRAGEDDGKLIRGVIVHEA